MYIYNQMAHSGLRSGCWQRDCSATNGGPPELDHSNKDTVSSIGVDALWAGVGSSPPPVVLPSPPEQGLLCYQACHYQRLYI